MDDRLNTRFEDVLIILASGILRIDFVYLKGIIALIIQNASHMDMGS